MSASERPGWPVRIAVMLFSGLFMLAFGGGGLYAGVLPLLDTARQAWIVRGWQPVSARVIEVRLDTRRGSKGGATYAVVARYAYRFEGRDFEASRVGLDTWSVADNIGDWQARWHHRLADAKARDQPVAAWVDPRRPERAVLERRVRWGLLALRLPFALIFTAVGLGAGVVFVRALLGRPTPLRRQLSSKAVIAAATRGQGQPGRATEGVIAARAASQWVYAKSIFRALPDAESADSRGTDWDIRNRSSDDPVARRCWQRNMACCSRRLRMSCRARRWTS